MAYYPPTDWELKDFYREHADALYRSCCFLTCGQGDAQKMMEEIFLSLLKKGMIFSSDKDARAWMILAAYKMSRKPPEASLEEKLDERILTASRESSEAVEPENSEEPSAEDVEVLTEAEEQDLTVDAPESVKVEEKVTTIAGEDNNVISARQFPEELRKLSRKDRLIALMYYCDGYRKAEIANYLGWPTFRVSNRLKRIKKCILSEKGVAEAC